MKAGLVVTAMPSSFDPSHAEASAREMSRELKHLDIEVIESGGLVTSWEQAREAADKFKKEGTDLLVVLCGTFALDDLSTTIVREMTDVPLIMWAIPEPPLRGGPLPTGSLLSAVMNGSSIRRMGKPYKLLYGNAGDPKVLEAIKQTVRVTQTIKDLKALRIGLIGYRSPGFYACTFDELELRKSIGPEIIHVDLSEVLRELDKVSEEEADAVVADLKQRFVVDGPTEEDLRNTVKLYVSMRRSVEKNKLSCMAIKCWPELRDYHDLGACFTLSRLNDEGIMSSCEADIHGVVTMSMLHSLTGRIIYFTDVVSINDERNAILMWHCGSTPTTLAEKPSAVRIRSFSIPGSGRGVTTEFPIKPGRVTIARLSAIKDEYRMFISGGEALKTEMILRGNPVEVKVDANVRDVLQKIATNGFEHHYAVVHGDVRPELTELCEQLKIQAVLA